MPSIIQRYVSANFILPFIFSSISAVSFLLIFQLFRITKLVVSKNVALDEVLQIIGYITITFIPMSTPLAVLFASIYALNKLSVDSELIVMRASGISIRRLFVPFFILGMTLGLLLFFLQYSFIPYAEKNCKQEMIKLVAKGVLSDIRPEQFFTDIPGITIYSEKVSEDGKKLSKVFIHFKDDSAAAKEGSEGQHGPGNKDSKGSMGGERVIFAQVGDLLSRNGDISSSNNAYNLKLINGNIVKLLEDEHGKKNTKNLETENKKVGDKAKENSGEADGQYFRQVEKILFKEYIFPLAEADLASAFTAKDSMRTTKELYLLLKTSYQSLTIGDEETRKELVKSSLEFFSRINNAVICIVFIFLGFSLGIQRGRGKNQNSILISFVVLVLYYALLFTAISFARSLYIPAWIAIFTPTLLTLLISFYFYRRLQWVV